MHGQRLLVHIAAAAALNSVRAHVRAGRDDLSQRAVDAMERGTGVGGEAGWQAVGHQLLVGRAASRVTVIMRTDAAGQQAESVVETPEWAAKRIRDAAVEPAERASADAAQQDAGLRGAAQGQVDAVDAPDREHVGGVPPPSITSCASRCATTSACWRRNSGRCVARQCGPSAV